MDLGDFDFDKLIHDLTMESTKETIDNMVNQMAEENPNAYALFAVGRIFGRFDVLMKLTKLIAEETEQLKDISKLLKGKK